MTKKSLTSSPLAQKLASIHQRMAAVSEEEVLSALRGEDARATVGAATLVRLHFLAQDGELRYGCALTQTA